jgi:hypothetical protein
MQCGAEVSDHFGAWMALGAAVIAAVIALAGVGLAGLIENRREAARRQHEKETRFHDERLAAYVEYIGAATSLFSAGTVWVESGAAGTLLTSGFVDLSPYTKSFARVSMLAKTPLRARLREVHRYAQRLTEYQPSNIVEQIVRGGIGELAAFEMAAKEELGID